MYDYKTLLLAYAIYKTEVQVEKLEALGLMEGINFDDVLIDVNQIKAQEKLMKTALIGMKIHQDSEGQYLDSFIEKLSSNKIELDLAFLK